MRSTDTFTDGRIHVTLLRGAFDLRALPTDERRNYNDLVGHFASGMELTAFMPLCLDERAGSDELRTLGQDLLDRLILEVYGDDNEEAGELLPWRDNEVRLKVESARQRFQMAS